MNRREVIALLSGAAVGCALPTKVAAEGRMLRLGVVSSSNPRSAPFWIAFDRRMRELGYVDGETYVLDFVNLSGRLERYEEETRAVASRKVDILIASGVERGLKSALEVTDGIPIVMVAIDYDPIARGYISNLGRPGGRVTGVSSQQIELTQKRVQLLKDAFPALAGAMVLWDRISADQWAAAQRIGQELGLNLVGIDMGEPPFDYDNLLAQAGRHRVAIVLMTPATFVDRQRVTAAAQRHGVATMFGLRPYVEAGGLMSYGPDINSIFRRAAEYVDRIAKGARPGDLPIEQPTRFELVVNLKTAKSLGISIPESLLARADEVIE